MKDGCWKFFFNLFDGLQFFVFSMAPQSMSFFAYFL